LTDGQTERRQQQRAVTELDARLKSSGTGTICLHISKHSRFLCAGACDEDVEVDIMTVEPIAAFLSRFIHSSSISFCSSGRASSVTALCVCVCVKQDGTDHNCYT